MQVEPAAQRFAASQSPPGPTAPAAEQRPYGLTLVVGSQLVQGTPPSPTTAAHWLVAASTSQPCRSVQKPA